MIKPTTLWKCHVQMWMQTKSEELGGHRSIPKKTFAVPNQVQ